MFKQLILLVSIVISASMALDNGVGYTPQMGWNSWNHFGCDINETVIMDTALALQQKLAPFGYEYVNIDDCWAISRNSSGYIQYDPEKFPNGIKYIADYVHSLGLKLGIYTDAGEYTCQKRPGSFGYEQIDADTYASWGIDYVKEDWCYTSNDDNALEQYTIMSKALNATGRQIFFSLCNWGTQSPWEWGATVGNSWRTTGDISDSFTSMLSNLDQQIPISSFSGVQGYNDPDMLEVGNGGMTNIEYTSHFSLWSLLAAPLIAGNDLRSIDDETLAILTAVEVIAVNQDPLCKQGALVRSYNGGLQQVWARPLADGSSAAVLFNRDEVDATIELQWVDIWKTPDQQLTVRDLWARSDIGEFTGSYTSVSIPSHGSVMLRVY